jgi:hypothetical protein
MPVLPIIDALVFLGWSSVMVAFLLKVIDISTSYRPHVFGLTAHDFLWASGIFILFAIALAARTWVKANEPRMVRERWRRLQQEPEAFHGWNGEPARVAADDERAAAGHALEAKPAPVRTRTPVSMV